MFVLLFYPLLSCLPMGVLALVLKVWRFPDEVQTMRSPITRKLLRAPGGSTRAEIEKLDDRILLRLCLYGAVALFTTGLFCANLASDPPLAVRLLTLAPVAVVYGSLIASLHGLLQQRRDRRLGLAGETAVGQELNNLLAVGCQVFHDFPLAENGNIDHVVVAPTGVFAIETKARRKGRPVPDGQAAHEVIYDGHGLQFPHLYDKLMVTQAQSQANSLSKVLSITLDEPIPVTPILALPGWFIRRKTSQGLLVLSSVKEIRHAILDERQPGLDPEQIARITAQIDAKCRDVEF